MDISQALKDKEMRKMLCEKSFKLFLLYYFSDNLGYKFADFHDDLIADLEDDNIQNLLVVMFREAAKTFICAVAFLCWYTVYKKGTYVVVISDEEGAAKKVMAKMVYQLQNNEDLINDFGQLYFERKERYKVSKKKQDGYFETANGITFLARGAGQKVRGALGNDIRRPDLILTDDLESLAKANSLDQRNKLENWFHSEPEAGANQTSGRNIVLANMLHKDSFCVRLRNSGIWKTHWIPLEKEGELAWPARWTHTQAQADEFNKDKPKEQWKVSIERTKKKYGSHVFNREFMLNPLDDGQVVIDDEWVRYYEGEKEWKNRDRYKIIMAVDPAVKTGDHNDFTAIALMAKEKITNNMYVIDYVNRKLNYNQIKDQIMLMDKSWHPKTILIEDVAAQNWLIQDLRDARLPVKEVPRKTDKRARLMAVSAHFENGLVYFRKNQTEMVNQITTFTGTDKDANDDMVDVITDCVTHFTQKPSLKGYKNKGVF